VTAVIGIVFGVVFVAWNQVYAYFGFLQPPVLQDWAYGVWLIPAVLAPLIIRKPGAALFAEMLAASVSALLGSQWGPDTLLSGFLQGAAAEAVFAAVRYRTWSLPILALAALASAAAAWVHDWFIYYAGFATDVQVVRLVIMGVSAVLFVALGSRALERSLRRAGVLEGFTG
jgi:energy-coupling factor transport system substrate-specific component